MATIFGFAATLIEVYKDVRSIKESIRQNSSASSVIHAIGSGIQGAIMSGAEKQIADSKIIVSVPKPVI